MLFKLFFISLIILYLILAFQSYIKYKIQKKLYNEAYELSKLKNKKLLVIGDPIESSTNALFGSYGYGDICIDMNLDTSNKNIPLNTILIKNKLENILHKFNNNSVVIFESETLEYVDNNQIEYVINELYRISNYDIFSIHQLKPNSIFTFFKTNGYMLFNYIFKKNIYKHNRLFKKHPPYNKFYLF